MTYIPDPANYVMKGNGAKKPLEASTRAETFVEDMTDDQLRKLARERLSEALQAVNAKLQPDLTVRLSNAVLDRIDGKPGQAITMDATVRSITVNATVQFIPASRDNLIIDHVDK